MCQGMLAGLGIIKQRMLTEFNLLWERNMFFIQ